MLAQCRLGIVLLIAQVLLVGSVFAEPDDRPPDVSPSANVDETLFLVRAIGHEYAIWPKDPWDGKEALKYCEDGRVHVKFLRSIAVRDRLDSAVCAMCDDYFTLIDEYESTLAREGEINDDALRAAISDAVGRFMVGGIKGLKAGAEADQEGKSELQVDGAVAQGLLDDGLKVFIEHKQERDQQTANSIDGRRAAFGQVVDFATQRNKKAVEGISQRRQWAAGEGGFDMPAGSALDVLAARRPRDPFAKMDLAANGITDKTTPAELVDRAHLCLDAARLVPPGETFDFYRVQCVAAAAGYACNAADLGLGETFQNQHTQFSQEAINISQTLQQLDPQDHQDGWVHIQLFRAYSAAGRLGEATTAAQPLLNSDWKDRQAFTVRYARVMGASGDIEQLERWLRVSYKLGYSDLDLVKKSADFDCLRTQRPHAYAELTTIKGSTFIAFGLINDDVVVRNSSPFPMTNLKLKFTVIKGGKIWNRERELPFVAANSDETLSNVFMVPDSRYDVYRWSLASDQGSLSSEDGQ